jgi:Icc-related predicted phosphoesterase
MKIALASDLHLEFGTISLTNDENADVLILSGDIMVANSLGDQDMPNIMGKATRSIRFHTFMQECSERFPHVVYIAGNHEHYEGDFAKTIPKLKEKFSYLSNVHVLDKECVTFDDVTFIGATLWTDMNKEDSLTLYHIKGAMNDFRVIQNSDRMVTRRVQLYKKDEAGQYIKNENGYMIIDGFKFKEEVSTFSPEDAIADHYRTIEYIKHIVGEIHDKKFVVCGHHAPSKSSTKPRYQDDILVNGAYSSDLSEFILDRPQIKAWTHGHTHDKFDYTIGSTRIICNPRGYIGYESRASEFKLQYFNV